MNTDFAELRQAVSDRLSTVDYLLTTVATAAQLIALTGERLAILSALEMLDARLEPSDDEATPTA